MNICCRSYSVNDVDSDDDAVINDNKLESFEKT